MALDQLAELRKSGGGRRGGSMREPLPVPSPLYSQLSDSLMRGIHRDALDAIQEVNKHLLEELCHAASGGGVTFPLAGSLRARFAPLQMSQIAQAAQCGVLLVDAGFSDRQRWNSLHDTCDDNAAYRTANWLSYEQALSLAHSTLLVAWHVANASPAVASVLLGMPYPNAIAYAQLSVKHLAHIARRYPHWIQPRWPRRSEMWSSILDFATDVSDSDSVRVTLRCLQLSGGPTPMPYVDIEG